MADEAVEQVLSPSEQWHDCVPIIIPLFDMDGQYDNVVVSIRPAELFTTAYPAPSPSSPLLSV